MRFLTLTLVCLALTGMLAACAPADTVSETAQVISVYASPAAEPWLAELYDCALSGTVLRIADSPSSADLVLRLGEPGAFTGSAYQIGSEQVLIVTHPQSAVENLTEIEVRDLFAGPGDPSLQVWVYARGVDVQQIFSRVVMDGRPVTSQARLATGPVHMAETLAGAPEAIGILPGRWEEGDLQIVFTILDVPVLALLEQVPRGAIQEIIACLH